MSETPQSPLKPWRLDTNARYKDAVKIIMDLSTAALFLPVFFLRDILSIPKERALADVLSYKIFLSWISLGLALLFGFVFYYASAKWIRLAWGKQAGFFRKKTTDTVVERVLDVSFLGAIVSFMFGVASALWFIVSFKPNW